MKPTLALTIAAAALSLGLSGCGQTGPLYMPAPPATPAPKASTPANPAPAATNSSSPAPKQQ